MFFTAFFLEFCIISWTTPEFHLTISLKYSGVTRTPRKKSGPWAKIRTKYGFPDFSGPTALFGLEREKGNLGQKRGPKTTKMSPLWGPYMVQWVTTFDTSGLAVTFPNLRISPICDQSANRVPENS